MEKYILVVCFVSLVCIATYLYLLVMAYIVGLFFKINYGEVLFKSLFWRLFPDPVIGNTYKLIGENVSICRVHSVKNNIVEFKYIFDYGEHDLINYMTKQDFICLYRKCKTSNA